ncbi:MAG: hypothetical protein A2087_12105 [Spirochaetes bacterium GWD1_61_31]|nr:MAG: hypothetical protein A2Y37_14405 [Spirochaetes bacterium GWB1_60_80]OHD28544.1 MAG: hypothetical protein A2004_02765 [Spirochaetes bacterium GWC1_61_12]OHD42643.1 MAG: hypothetical protein A2087_12105 [Spirochaetes bacterium GWD1_61_31]OHD44538.1 MAG: hypothetical protein A2Y35_05245 [Spirochaetes bacterium GWE1_60_18]OHD58673.1 MAG: hypothetical protein A2Y32_03370 [Spirochaetes bacterium GWF1_60_12]HAP43193.1 hypothetical protein [Spirochaetaceae bacterium]
MALPDPLFKAAFNQTHQAMIVLNEQGIPVLWNEAFYELFFELAGLGPDQLAVPLFDWLQERDAFQYSYYLTEVLLGRMGSASIETNLKTAQGSRVWLRTMISLLSTPRESQPEPSDDRWLWCMFQNITAQKRREHDLVSAKESAEKATLTKSQFLANMSHEIRTPIQTILGMTELLNETGLDTEQQDYISSVRFSADVLLGLINDILDFSKIEAGKIELEEVDFDLPAFLRQSVALLILDAHKKQLEVIIDIHPQLPRLVRGDTGKLRQILVNLFKNAIKFTASGEIVITASLQTGAGQPAGTGLQAGPSQPIMLLKVSDSGSGIPAKLVDKLFTPFTQASSGRTTQGGTGLGLAISRYLAKLMGGSVYYEPNHPQGSVFSLNYPLCLADYSLPAPDWRLPRPASLLIVDDHAAALQQARILAERLGLKTVTVDNGPSAIKLLQKAATGGHGFSICLIDQEMPGMDGWRLAAEITADRLINNTKLVLMAPEGTANAEVKMKHLKWFNAYLSKPINPQSFFETIKLVLEEKTELDPADEAEDAGLAKPENPQLSLDILLAEDHLVNQELFTLLLKKMGSRVDVAGNGQEAVDKAIAKNYDLVLMDIFMPVMDGYEASHQLREHGFNRPIIAVTASALKGERDKCIAAGMNDILIKPFKRKDLEAMISFWSNRASHSQSMLPIVEAEEPIPAACGDSSFDFVELVETFLGQHQTVVDLVGRFISKTRGQLDELAAAIQNADHRQAREICHSIKGAAWNMTARPLGNLARDLEQAARDANLPLLAEHLPALRKAFAEFEVCAVHSIEPYG